MSSPSSDNGRPDDAVERSAKAAGVQVGPGIKVTEKTVNLAISGQIAVSIVGLLVGALAFCLGSVLVAMGVTGSTHWATEVLGSKVEVNDTYPGVGLVVAGILIGIATRYNVKIGK